MAKVSLLALVAIVAVTMTTITAQTPTFRAGIDLATFGITVIDKKGEFLTDLTAEDFEVVEDGQKQTVKYFARGTDLENGPEMHVGLLFDTSGSMDGHHQAVFPGVRDRHYRVPRWASHQRGNTGSRAVHDQRGRGRIGCGHRRGLLCHEAADHSVVLKMY